MGNRVVTRVLKIKNRGNKFMVQIIAICMVVYFLKHISLSCLVTGATSVPFAGLLVTR